MKTQVKIRKEKHAMLQNLPGPKTFFLRKHWQFLLCLPEAAADNVEHSC